MTIVSFSLHSQGKKSQGNELMFVYPKIKIKKLWKRLKSFNQVKKARVCSVWKMQGKLKGKSFIMVSFGVLFSSNATCEGQNH